MLLRKKMDWKNKLYFGGNPGILREHVAPEEPQTKPEDLVGFSNADLEGLRQPAESVDLIYLDPPFNSSAEALSFVLTPLEFLAKSSPQRKEPKCH